MAKRMKLVPEKLYNKLMMHGGDQTEFKISENKSELLGNNSDLPDDLKILLIQELTRNLTRKVENREKNPLLIKNVGTSPSILNVPASPQSPIKSKTFDSPIKSRTAHESTTSRIPVKSQREVDIQNYLESIGINNNEDDEVVIGDTTYANSEYSTIVEGLAGARMPPVPTPGLESVLSLLASSKLPTQLFTAKVKRMIHAGFPRTSKSIKAQKKLQWTNVK